MPVYRGEYRHWDGALRGRFFRWLTIARAGVRLTSRSKWLKRFVLIAWLPLLYYGFVFFVVGRLTEAATIEKAKDLWQFQVMAAVFGNPLADEFLRDPAGFRPLIWSLLIHLFLRYTQVFSVIGVVAIVGPRLVSEDLRSRALALYFSKPLTRADYVLGKLGVVAFWVGTVSLLPALVLYALSIVFSPGMETIAQTIGLVPRLILYGGLLMLGTGTLVLALSSLTPNPRFLGFIWIGLWVLGSLAATILSNIAGRRVGEVAAERAEWARLFSLLHDYNAVGFALFDVRARLEPLTRLSPWASRTLESLSVGHPWVASLAVIAALSVLSLVVLLVRIGRPGEADAR